MSEGGTELASGYVSLHVKYASAQGQIAKDFNIVESQSALTGERAGKNLSDGMARHANLAAMTWRQSIADGINKGMVDAGQTAQSSIRGSILSGISSAFGEVGTKSGKALQEGLGATITSLQGKNLQLRASILNAGNAYENLKNSGTASNAALAESHNALRALINEQRQNTILLADAHYKYGIAAKQAGVEAKRAAEDAKSSVGGLGGVLSKAKSDMGELGLAGASTAGMLGGMGGALASLATNPIVLVTAAVLALGTGVGVVIDKLFHLGEEWTNVADAIEIQTGATGAKLTALKGDVEAVAGSIPLSIKDITQIAISASSAMGDTGQGLRDVTKVIGDLQSMVGKVDLTSFGRGVRAFGLGGDSQAQIGVLNQLMAASQATQIPINSLISTFARAAPAMQAFHLTMGQTVAVLTELDKVGVDPQKMMFSLSHAVQAAQKAHLDFNTVLEDTVVRIRNARTEQEKLDIAKALVGPTSGRGGAATLVEAVNNGLDLTPELLEKLKNVGNVIEDTRGHTLHWAEDFKMLKNSISVALGPLGETVFKGIEGQMKTLGEWIGNHKTAIVGFFGAVTKAGAVMVEGLVKIVAGVAQILGDMTSMFGRAVKWIGDGLSDLGGAMSHLPGRFGQMGRDIEGAGHVLQHFGDSFDASGKKVTSWGANLQNTSSNIIPAAFKAIDDALAKTNTAADGATNAIKAIPGALQALASQPKPPPIKIEVQAVPGQGITMTPDGLMSIALGINPSPGVGGGFAPPSQPGGPGDVILPPNVRHQTGGGIGGYGGGDIVPALLEPGEHVWEKEAVAGAGGHGAMVRARMAARQGSGGGGVTYDKFGRPIPQSHPQGHSSLPPLEFFGWLAHAMGFASGGGVHKILRTAGHGRHQKTWVQERFGDVKLPKLHFQEGGEVLTGEPAAVAVLQAESGRTPYRLGGFSTAGIDCSGLVSEVVNVFLGQPALSTGDRMATGSEAGWLSKKGFVQGRGPAGTLRIGFYNGGPGGGHTALTLPSGINAESGGSGGGVRLGGGAAGADNPEFTDHWYLPFRAITAPAGYGGSGGAGSGSSGAAGGSGGATAAQVGAANDRVTESEGKVRVAQDRVTEAEAALDKERDKKIGKGPKGQEAHDRAVASAEQTVKDRKDELDRLQGDLDTRRGEVDSLTGGATAAENRLTEAKQRQHDAEVKLQEDQANPRKKPSQIEADENAVAKAKEAVAKAEENLQKVHERKPKGDKGERAEDKELGTLADLGFAGVRENMPPGFSDPTQWGMVKSGAGLFRFLGALMKSKGGGQAGAGLSLIGDLMGGKGSGAIQDIMGMMSPGAYGDVGIGSPGDIGAGSELYPDIHTAGGFAPPSQPGAPDSESAKKFGGLSITNNQNITNHGVDPARASREVTAGMHDGIRSDLKLASTNY